MSRSAIAIGVGLLVGVLTMVVIESIGHALYPHVVDVDPADKEAFRAAVAQLPLGSLVFVLLAWSLGTMHGAGMAAHLAYNSRVGHGLIVGGVLMLAGIWQLISIPHPGWFAVAGLLLFAGSRIAPRSPRSRSQHHEGWIVKEAPNYSRM